MGAETCFLIPPGGEATEKLLESNFHPMGPTEIGLIWVNNEVHPFSGSILSGKAENKLTLDFNHFAQKNKMGPKMHIAFILLFFCPDMDSFV